MGILYADVYIFRKVYFFAFLDIDLYVDIFWEEYEQLCKWRHEENAGKQSMIVVVGTVVN